jgi:hypothetical protein
MVKNHNRCILIHQAQMVCEVSRPEDLHPANPVDVPRREHLLQLHGLRSEGRVAAETLLYALFERFLGPDELLAARKSIQEAADLHHEYQAGRQVDGAVQQLILIRHRSGQFRSQDLLDLVARQPVPEVLRYLDDVAMGSDGGVAASVVESGAALFGIIMEVRVAVYFAGEKLSRVDVPAPEMFDDLAFGVDAD